ncbi:hypothetical protein P5V15_010246 [Pogonomyrmex californicus]
MVAGIRKRIEMEKREARAKMEAVMVRMINLLGKKWRVVGVYVNGDMEKKWKKLRGWGENKENGTRTIIGGNFTARTGETGSWWETEKEQGEERDKRAWGFEMRLAEMREGEAR